MRESEFYYGLPQDQWDILLAKAEDLLRDEELGSHLVGLYPAGNRIYGIESESQGVFCLYVDSVESLIDPSTPKKNGFSIFRYGYARAPIIMADLFDWARWMIRGTCGWQVGYFAHAIPFGNDIIYQDDSLIEILDNMRSMMRTKRFSIPAPDCTTNSVTGIFKLLYKRATLILSSTGKFYPCINPAWGSVYNIASLQINVPNYILELDREFRNGVLDRSPMPSQDKLDELETWYDQEIMHAQVKAGNVKSLASKAGQSVANLYRFQL